MKRGKPLARTQPLKRATAPLSRSKGLKRGNVRLSRSKPQKAILSLATARLVYDRQHGLCACGCGGRIAPFPIGYHHILPKAKWPELADNSLNAVGVTADCHANHETRSKPLTLKAVAVLAKRTLTDRQRSYLERTYT